MSAWPRSFRQTSFRQASPKQASRTPLLRSFLPRLLALLLLLAACWAAWVVHCINQVADEDQAQPADAIAVFGAAEYNGRPSPVYHARLDHAAALYDRHIAPFIVTLGGGADRDSGKSEGGVGRDYLLAKGVPNTAILPETHSVDTSQQAALLADMARDRGFRHVVVVSDGTHLFRIQALCARDGLDVYTSPRPALGRISNVDLWGRYWHEVVSYTGVRLGLDRTRALHWLVGKTED